MRILRARPASTVMVVAALAATLTATATAVLTGPAGAAQGCQVAYTPNQWPGGFTATVKVSPGDTAVSTWTVTWTYAGDERVTSGWNATVSQSGSTVTARNASYNGSIPAGGSTEFGLQGTFGSSGGAPTGFSLNGVPCNGATPPPTTPPPTTTPPPAGGCTATYTVTNQWQGGFQVEVRVTAGAARSRAGPPDGPSPTARASPSPGTPR
ncbi:cellulose binding domain-containing protein [Micromonospora tarensis]|uniref:cellulose binding domain-containing protein n=1 Tax=Micromonospora tarensis TaxID=2806100 RepID=UPI003898DDF6